MAKWIQYDNGYLNKTPIFQFILLSCLFPLWGAAASLNDVLITQFKSVFELSDFASALVQSAFYSGYFLISIPASMVIKKTTYKTAIHFGTIGEKGDKYFLNNGILANSIGFYGFPAKKDTTIEWHTKIENIIR